jgi:CheY-like chemotaxis protein
MPRILLIEDEEAIQAMLSLRLERAGYEVALANNGEEGLSMVRQTQPDLILMDIRMPVLDGLETAQQLKQSHQTAHIPIIALTADSLLGDREKCLAAGCDEYETKPIVFPQLMDKIQRLLALRPSARHSAPEVF